jgi:hypothetical protein
MLLVIGEYFEKCEKDKEPITITGLQSALKMPRQTFSDYRKKPEFSDILEQARLHCLHHVEINTFNGKFTPSYAIWYGKVHFKQQEPPKQIDIGAVDRELDELANKHGMGRFEEIATIAQDESDGTVEADTESAGTEDSERED